jgi:TRAP transporter TAXI family solute receptor
MIKKNIIILIIVLCLFLVSAPSKKSYILATASTGGTYYPVGVALSTLIKVKIEPKYKVSMSAISSAGSGENIKLIREKEAQFAILQGLYGYYAWNGTGQLAKSGKQKYLRSISMLWLNVEQFIIDKNLSKNNTISDILKLKGKNMAFGKKNSGTIGSNKKILENLGVNIEKQYKLLHAGYGPSATALQDGKVSGVGIPAGVPTGAITALFAVAHNRIAPLSFTKRQLKTVNKKLNLWIPYTIKAGTYPNLNKDWKTIAQPNFLAVHKNVDEEFVYLLTKTIYENLLFLQAIHKATLAMNIKKAIAGLPVPLHKGAVRYYKEMGITIPKKLLSN